MQGFELFLVTNWASGCISFGQRDSLRKGLFRFASLMMLNSNLKSVNLGCPNCLMREFMPPFYSLSLVLSWKQWRKSRCFKQKKSAAKICIWQAGEYRRSSQAARLSEATKNSTDFLLMAHCKPIGYWGEEERVALFFGRICPISKRQVATSLAFLESSRTKMTKSQSLLIHRRF